MSNRRHTSHMYDIPPNPDSHTRTHVLPQQQAAERERALQNAGMDRQAAASGPPRGGRLGLNSRRLGVRQRRHTPALLVGLLVLALTAAFLQQAAEAFVIPGANHVASYGPAIRPLNAATAPLPPPTQREEPDVDVRRTEGRSGVSSTFHHN